MLVPLSHVNNFSEHYYVLKTSSFKGFSKVAKKTRFYNFSQPKKYRLGQTVVLVVPIWLICDSHIFEDVTKVFLCIIKNKML